MYSPVNELKLIFSLCKWMLNSQGCYYDHIRISEHNLPSKEKLCDENVGTYLVNYNTSALLTSSYMNHINSAPWADSARKMFHQTFLFSFVLISGVKKKKCGHNLHLPINV